MCVQRCFIISYSESPCGWMYCRACSGSERLSLAAANSINCVEGADFNSMFFNKLRYSVHHVVLLDR